MRTKVTALVFIFLFFAIEVYSLANFDIEERKNDVFRKERIDLYEKFLVAAEKISREVNNPDVEAIFMFLRDRFALSEPVEEEGLMIRVVREAKNKNSTVAALTPLLEGDASLSLEWGEHWKSDSSAIFIPSKNTPLLIIKKDKNRTDFWNVLTIFYEATRALLYINDPKSMYDTSGIFHALNVKFAIMDYYGGKEYKEFILKASKIIQKGIKENDMIPFLPDIGFEEVNLFFGESSSFAENVSKLNSVWIRSVFLALEEINGSCEKSASEKGYFIQYLMANNVLK